MFKNRINNFSAKQYYYILLGVIAILSRLPQLNLGFGLDFDAWHMAS